MLLTLKLKKIRLKEQKKLDSRNIMIFKSITKYIQGSDLTNYQKEEVLQQIMDMILQAQIEDRDINLFVGDDIEDFCNSIINEYNSNLNIFYRVLDFLQRYMICTFSILFIPLIIIGIWNGFNFNLSVSIDNFITISIISLFVIRLSKKDIQKNAFIAPLPFKYSLRNNYTSKGLSIYVFILIGYDILKTSLSNSLNLDLSSHYIYFFNNKLFLIILLIIILSIQVYKINFNKQKS